MRGNNKIFTCTISIVILLFLLRSDAQAQAFSAQTVGDYGNVTVMDASGNYDAMNPDGSVNTTPRRTVTKEFFKTHGDDFDYVVVFTNFNYQMPNSGSKAFYLGVKNDTQGIGKDPFDHTALFGSNGRLQGMIDMGNVANLTTDPLNANFEETLFLLSHELMHRWGAFVKYRDENGNNNSGLLGSTDHWSYLLNSASVLYGNRWQDNGNGTFTSLGKGTNYSPLDLYLMGLLDRSRVPPMLLIDNPGIDPTQRPSAGVTISGTAKYVIIDDIIAANGERVPGASVSPKSFRTAFILLTRPGTYEEAERYGIESIRKGAATHFSVQTDGKGIMTISSAPTETIPQNPGAVAPPVTPRTRPADVNEGMTWLLSRQYPDGHWEDSPQTAIRDTAAAVETLRNISWDPAGLTSLTNGIGWLTSTYPKNTDYTARTLVALRLAGRDAPDLVSRLGSEQNSDNGWGSGRNFASNAMDTGLALRALAIGGSGGIPLAGANDYLIATQNDDGGGLIPMRGWGVNPGAASGILPTAEALRGHLAFQPGDVSDRTMAARNWLVSRQDTDGGFGSGPSAVYDTAIAVTALTEHLAGDPAISGGVSYLRNKQAENGSWNDSVYQTALAVNALWRSDPAADLSIVSDDIVISPAVVTTIPETITITAYIGNYGGSEAPGAMVALYDGAPASGLKIAEQTVSIGAYGRATVTFTTTASNAIEHTYFIFLDPQNAIPEKTKTNNIAWKTLQVNVTVPIVGFSAPASSGNESVSPVRIPVTLNTAAALPVTVGYTVNPASTATSGSDYILAAGTLIFAPGETVKYIDLTIIDDRLAEPSETVVIDLANPVNAVPGQDRHIYTILDNDVMPAMTIISPLPSTITSTNTPTLLYMATPANVAATVKVDGLIVNKTSGSRLDELSNAAHTLRIEASDGVNAVFAEVIFTINYTPPVVTLRSPVASVYTDTTPLIRYALNKEAIVVVKVDGVIVDKISGDSLDALPDGEHIVRVEATDAGGMTGFAETAFIVYTGAQQTYALSSSVQLPIEMTGNFNLGRIVKGVAYDAYHTIYTVSDNGCNDSLRVTKYDSSVVKEWASPLIAYGGSTCAKAAGIAVDANGNSYAHVQSDGGLLNYPNMAYTDAYLLSLNKDGAVDWAQQSKVTECIDWADKVSIGLDGAIYAAARTGCGTNNGQSAVWRKYDESGVCQSGTEWYLGSYNGTYLLSGVAKVTADIDGNVYVAGYTDAGIISPNAGSVDIFVMSFSSSGSLRWAHQNGTAFDDVVTDLAVDDLGGVYVTGYTDGGGLDGNASLGGSDAFVTKLDSGTGTRKWTYQFGSSGNDRGYAITAEKNGILYVTGDSGGSIAGADGSGRVFVLKGDGSGNAQFNRYWVKQFGTTGVGKDISLGALGYVYVRENDGAANVNTLHTLRHPRLPAASLHHDPMHAVGSSLTITGTITGATGISDVKTDTNATGGLATYPTSSTWLVTVSGLKPGKNHLAITTAKNAMGFRDTVYGMIQMVDSLPVIATTALPASILYESYSQKLVVTGGMPPYTWTVTSGSLPTNLVLNRDTGVINNWPDSVGMFTFIVQVTDAYGWKDAKALSIGVYDSMVITTATLPSGIIGIAYSQTLAATGGLQPYAWSIVSGALPAGLTLDHTTGVISGVPPADGLSTVTVQVSDVNNFTTTKTLALTIDSKAFTSFAIQNIASNGVIDAVAKTISITVPFGTDVTYLIATFSTTGTRVTVGSAIQTSGITANNFSSPVAYTVTSVDGSTATYIVTVTVAPYSPSISTIAGTGSSGYGGDNGPALQATFGYLSSVAVSTLGAIYVADSDNYRVRKFTVGGTISTVVGTGTGGFSGDGGQAKSAKIGYLDSPPTIDKAGNLYIADTENHRIRKISTSGIITTIAGTGTAGFSGDGGQAVNAKLNYPDGVAVDSAENLYITDSFNRRIRKISTSGIITTIAGTGQAGFSGDGGPALQATFGQTSFSYTFYGAPALDAAGNIYIPDVQNFRIRKIDVNGIITTITGNGLRSYSGDGGPATMASISLLESAPVIDASGNIYFADIDNNRIRKVDTNGIITTIAGTEQAGFNGDGGPASFALFDIPSGIAFGISGEMYITDAFNYRIRRIAGNGPVISTASLPSGMVGATYSRALGVTGGKSPYTWSIISGSLSSGLTLSASSGIISGTPTSAGTSTFTVQVKDANNMTDARQYPLIISAQLTIASSALASGTTGSVYSQMLTATGGMQPYVWSTITGTLPAGLALSPAGMISGVPTSAGTSTVTYMVTDATNVSKTKALGITINGPVNITTTTLATGVTGTVYSQTLAATGGKTPYTWSITSGSLSSGLTLSTTSGKITGTPTSAGTSMFTVQVKDAVNATDSRALSIVVYAPLSISTSILASGNTGSAYSQTLAATGGLSPYLWSTATGTLPVGLTLSSGGVISGNPTSAGTSTVTYKVTDANSRTSTKSLGITIVGPLSITTTTLASGTTGTSYSQALAATGGRTPYSWMITAGSGTLPPGLTLNNVTGMISGTPMSAGTNTFTVQATDVDARIAAKTLSITVTAAPPRVAQLDLWTSITSTSPNRTGATNMAAGSFTVSSSSNRLLLVAVVMEVGTVSNPTITASYGGTALTQIGITANTQREIVWMGYLKDAQIGSGSKALTVSFSGASGNATGLHVKWSSYAGVNQTTPIASSAARNAASTSVTFNSTINYVNNGMTTVVSGNGGSPATGTLTATPAFTAGTAITTNAHTSRTFTTATHTAAGSYASSIGVSWTGTTSAWSGLAVVSLQP